MNGQRFHAPGWAKILGSGLVVAAIWIVSTIWSAGLSAGTIHEEIEHVKADIYTLSQNEHMTDTQLVSIGREVYALERELPELNQSIKSLEAEVTKLRIEIARGKQ